MADEMDDRRNRYNERELGQEFADPHYSEQQQLARSFADPNALDDARLGKSFEDTNSSGKRKKSPDGVRTKPPTDRRKIAIFLVAFLLLFLIVVIAGWLPRREREREIDRRAKEQQDAKPMVNVA